MVNRKHSATVSDISDFLTLKGLSRNDREALCHLGFGRHPDKVSEHTSRQMKTTRPFLRHESEYSFAFTTILTDMGSPGF